MTGKWVFRKKTSNGTDAGETGGNPIKKRPFLRVVLHWVGIVAGLLGLLIVVMLLVMNTWPGVGANGADLLRGVIGDKAVAGLEMEYIQLQDTLLHWKYDLGLVRPAEAWDSAPTITAIPTSTIPSGNLAKPLPNKGTPEGFSGTPTWGPTTIPEPVMTHTPSFLQPVNIPPLGDAKGEGIWIPYIQGANGETLAFRSFLQPDPSRPYTLVAIVAFDLNHTHLHFVMGTQEPAAPNGPPRSGEMPKADKVANVLLAAFNGGFKATHGEFGAMMDGVTYLPPREGLGTLAIYRDGKVRLGEWGKDVFMTPDIVSLRQNGPLVVQGGHISTRIYDNSPKDWGYTVNDVSPTIRTGIGLSADGRTLYYFCGPSLSMDMLARAMQAAGAENAIQLDINNYWTLFVKVRADGSKLVAEPLLPQFMVAYTDRYLYDSSRDFFYVTASGD